MTAFQYISRMTAIRRLAATSSTRSRPMLGSVRARCGAARRGAARIAMSSKTRDPLHPHCYRTSGVIKFPAALTDFNVELTLAIALQGRPARTVPSAATYADFSFRQRSRGTVMELQEWTISRYVAAVRQGAAFNFLARSPSPLRSGRSRRAIVSVWSFANHSRRLAPPRDTDWLSPLNSLAAAPP